MAIKKFSDFATNLNEATDLNENAQARELISTFNVKWPGARGKFIAAAKEMGMKGTTAAAYWQRNKKYANAADVSKAGTVDTGKSASGDQAYTQMEMLQEILMDVRASGDWTHVRDTQSSATYESKKYKGALMTLEIPTRAKKVIALTFNYGQYGIKKDFLREYAVTTYAEVASHLESDIKSFENGSTTLVTPDFIGSVLKAFKRAKTPGWSKGRVIGGELVSDLGTITASPTGDGAQMSVDLNLGNRFGNHNIKVMFPEAVVDQVQKIVKQVNGTDVYDDVIRALSTMVQLNMSRGSSGTFELESDPTAKVTATKSGTTVDVDLYRNGKLISSFMASGQLSIGDIKDRVSSMIEDFIKRQSKSQSIDRAIDMLGDDPKQNLSKSEFAHRVFTELLAKGFDRVTIKDNGVGQVEYLPPSSTTAKLSVFIFPRKHTEHIEVTTSKHYAPNTSQELPGITDIQDYFNLGATEGEVDSVVKAIVSMTSRYVSQYEDAVKSAKPTSTVDITNTAIVALDQMNGIYPTRGKRGSYDVGAIANSELMIHKDAITLTIGDSQVGIERFSGEPSQADIQNAAKSLIDKYLARQAQKSQEGNTAFIEAGFTRTKSGVYSRGNALFNIVSGKPGEIKIKAFIGGGSPINMTGANEEELIAELDDLQGYVNGKPVASELYRTTIQALDTMDEIAPTSGQPGTYDIVGLPAATVMVSEEDRVGVDVDVYYKGKLQYAFLASHGMSLSDIKERLSPMVDLMFKRFGDRAGGRPTSPGRKPTPNIVTAITQGEDFDTVRQAYYTAGDGLIGLEDIVAKLKAANYGPEAASLQRKIDELRNEFIMQKLGEAL